VPAVSGAIMRAESWGAPTALLLMAVSGFAGLGYQIVWTQQCGLWLGHESAGVLAVVAAFFGGLACGAGLFGGRVERSRQPVRWYVGCELSIAGWALVLTAAIAPFGQAMLVLTGPQPTALWQWTVAFGGTFLVLLPATAAMGATLPAIERILTERGSTDRSIAAPYASNTAGAVFGVLAAAFWLVPEYGLLRTSAICIVMRSCICISIWARCCSIWSSCCLPWMSI